MRVYILSRNPNLYSTRRLVEAAEKKGWEIKVIDYLLYKIVIFIELSYAKSEIAHKKGIINV